MLRTLCCISLLIGWPLSAQANSTGEIFYEHNYQQSTDTIYNVGIAFNDDYSNTQIGLMHTHIPNYSSDPYHPQYNIAFLYMGGSTPGAVSLFFDTGIDILTLVESAMNAAIEDTLCDDNDLYYSDCWASDFIELNPNFFLTLGVKLKTQVGNLAMFWRYYWLDNGLEYGRRYYLGVRYSLHF